MFNLFIFSKYTPIALVHVLIWITGFLTAVLQTHARKLKISVDQLNFTYDVIDDSQEDISDISKMAFNVIIPLDIIVFTI